MFSSFSFQVTIHFLVNGSLITCLVLNFLKFISSFKSFDNILNNFKFSSKKLMFFYILTSVVNSPDILNLEEKFQIVLAKSCGW